ncbi:MAG: hypothetical protein LBS82_03855 [Spirochaetaceae bacterium]|jgi:hypothetical protein|nr:hypothetical protein [Spirochaetaceae bacterium]
MIKIDGDYTPYFIDDDPAYPGGKAKAVSQGNLTDGTPWRALWFNTILGFFQAVIVEAWGQFTVDGQPDKVGHSDLLDAIKQIMTCAVNPFMDNRIAANTQNISANLAKINLNTADVSVLKQYVQGLTEEAPSDGRIYGRKNRAWAEVTAGGGSAQGDAIEAFKFYSKQSIMFTNARIVDRRARGWDIGLPCLSAQSEVYHFDTDAKNQNQASSIAIGFAGDAPILVGKDDSNGVVFFNPAVREAAPFEMMGRSLFGRFSMASSVPNSNSTVEFWARFTQNANIALLRAGRPSDDEFVFHIVRGDPDYSEPEPAAGDYSEPEEDGVAYSAAAEGDPEYCAPTPLDVPYWLTEEDGVPYDAAITHGNYIEHNWPGGSEAIDVDDDVAIAQNAWFHFALVFTQQEALFFIGQSQISIPKKSAASVDAVFEINEEEDELNVDELTIDRTVAESFEGFAANTEARIPYAALDYKEKWAVLMVQDPAKVKTNLFETEQFRAAVQAAINS